MTDPLPNDPHRAATSDLRSLTDSEIWRRINGSDEAAFKELIRRYYRPLYQYGHRFSRDTDILKDCIQDLFVDLWQYHRTIVRTEYVRVYLFKSLRRKLYKDYARRTAVEPFEEVTHGDFLPVESWENQYIETELATHRQQRLQSLLETLTERQQEAIHLKFFGALSNDKIAEVMGLSYQSVGNLLHRALSKLRYGWHTLLAMLLMNQ